MSEFRYDRGSLRPPRRTPQGFLRVDGYASRVGVFEYTNTDGSTRRELRLPEDVFDAESLASYEQASVTDDHPPEMITAENVRTFEVGSIIGARRDGDHVAVDFVVKDAATIAKMDGGKVELSNGYRVTLEKTAGEHPLYGRYDAIQRKVKINHLALVDVGRAGPSARVRMDAAVQTQTCTPAKVVHTSVTGAKTMPTPKTEDLLAAAGTQLAAAEARATAAEQRLAGETSRADAAAGRVAALETEVAALRESRTDADKIAEKDAEIKTHKDRADVAERALAGFEDRLAAGVKSRVQLERKATMVMGPEFKMDGLTDREVAAAVVEKLHNVVVDVKESPDYVRARFDAAVEGWAACNGAIARLSDAAAEIDATRRADAVTTTAKSAREQMIARNRSLATTPTVTKGA